MVGKQTNGSQDSTEQESSRKSSCASDQATATTLEHSVEADQAVPNQSRSSPVGQANKLEATEIINENGRHGLEQPRLTHIDCEPVKDSAPNEIIDPLSALVSKESLLEEVRRLTNEMQEIWRRQKNNEEEIWRRGEVIQELSSKLESYESNETSPYKKIFNEGSEAKSITVPGVSRGDKREFKEECKYTCQVSGIQGKNKSTELHCAHIWPKHAHEQLISIYGEKYSINGTENLSLFHADVEKEFDSGRICFLLCLSPQSDQHPECIRMYILDPKIRDQRIGETEITFSDLNGQLLDMTCHLVSGTLLANHAKKAIHYAFVKKWITPAEKESLLTMARFSSPDCVRSKEISHWLSLQNQTQTTPGS
jgi:hypothetical protein